LFVLRCVPVDGCDDVRPKSMIRFSRLIVRKLLDVIITTISTIQKPKRVKSRVVGTDICVAFYGSSHHHDE
jgi:hypothetical protein